MAAKTEYIQRSPWRRSTPSMKFGDSPHSSEVQPSLLADAWVCRSCGEYMEFSRPQASPGSCRGCLGTRFSAVLETSRHRRLLEVAHDYASRKGLPAFTE